MFLRALTIVSERELRRSYILRFMFISSENSMEISSFARVMHHAIPPRICVGFTLSNGDKLATLALKYPAARRISII
jgi:hypothetical protein